jgi:hypothetical protein
VAIGGETGRRRTLRRSPGGAGSMRPRRPPVRSGRAPGGGGGGSSGPNRSRIVSPVVSPSGMGWPGGVGWTAGAGGTGAAGPGEAWPKEAGWPSTAGASPPLTAWNGTCTGAAGGGSACSGVNRSGSIAGASSPVRGRANPFVPPSAGGAPGSPRLNSPRKGESTSAGVDVGGGTPGPWKTATRPSSAAACNPPS